MTQYSALEAIEKRQKKFKAESKGDKFAGMEQADLVVRVNAQALLGGNLAKISQASCIFCFATAQAFLRNIIFLLTTAPQITFLLFSCCIYACANLPATRFFLAQSRAPRV